MAIIYISARQIKTIICTQDGSSFIHVKCANCSRAWHTGLDQSRVLVSPDPKSRLKAQHIWSVSRHSLKVHSGWDQSSVWRMGRRMPLDAPDLVQLRRRGRPLLPGKLKCN
uniref:Uncharacterized protein n=1 Tax=Schistocephalus solidus TaxID=70667 RepID=A0A0V0J9N4_SCHSO